MMQEAMERWNAEGTVEYVEAIKFSRGRQLESITVGNATFATAHEAAYGLAEAVRTVWVTAGGDGPVEECERLQSGLEAVAMPANLYGLIEVEYHAVLNGTEEGANSEHGQPDAPLSVSLDPPQVTIDGHPYGLSDTQAAFVQQLLDAGDWVSGKDIDLGTRAGRIRKSLPGPVADIVESRDGVGFRVRPEYLA
ncbi:MAG: hypothetical protein HQ582_14000 [Planctomycetes bacterium]|nr:hypothetical protein [Planctomycetota bacterium]